MRSQRISGDGPQAIYLLVFDPGDEVVAALGAFAGREKLQVCRVTAIGALSDLVLGYFDVDKREYARMVINEQVEVLTLAGNITEADGRPRLHVHVTVGKADGTTLGGHLLEAHVRPTLEMFLATWPTRVQRRLDERSGLMLIDLP
jgi:uncharacterized protein